MQQWRHPLYWLECDGARLSSEAEWEPVASQQSPNGQFYHDQSLHLLASDKSDDGAMIRELFGNA